MMAQPWWRPAAAEFLGAFTLVFAGVGSIITMGRVVGTGATEGALLAIALAHGLAIAVMVTALGHISGGHFNPAVTVAAVFTRRIPVPLGAIYVVFQLLGGLVGAFLLVAALPQPWWEAVDLGTPQVHAELSTAKAVLLEAVMTFFLVLVVFGVGMDERNTSRAMAGFAIGLTITMDILIGGPFTGAAMNPARALGPALLSETWEHHFVYWAGPLLGGIIAGLVYDTAWVQARRPPQVAPPPGESPPPMP